VRRTPDGFLELLWAASSGGLTTDPRADQASPHAATPQPSFVRGLPPATRLPIHTPMPLDEKLAYIYTYAHGAQEMNLYCEAPHVPDLEQRLVTSLAPAFATLRSFRLLHNVPLESQPSRTDGDCYAYTSFESVLPRFQALTYLHTFSSYLTPAALRNLPPNLVELHVDVFRCGSEFCDPAAVLDIFLDPQADLQSLRRLVVYDDEPEAVWAALEADIVEAAARRGVQFEWWDSWEGDVWNRHRADW
jgi:hypothetical protein